MNILGIYYRHGRELGSDSAACLLKDGKLVAFAEEDKLTRIKRINGAFPEKSIGYCVKEAGISLSDIDIVAIPWDSESFDNKMAKIYLECLHQYHPVNKESIKWCLKQLENMNSNVHVIDVQNFFNQHNCDAPKIEFVRHHLAHAASTFYMSGFDKASIMIADAHGENECTSFWKGEGRDIEEIGRVELPHSLGWYYVAYTVFCGFVPKSGEGKLMGLAGYGEHNKEIEQKVSEVLKINNDLYELNPNLIYGEHNKSKFYTDWFEDIMGKPRKSKTEVFFDNDGDINGIQYANIDQYYKDVAFMAQNYLEKALTNCFHSLYKKTSIRKFCLAGGVHLNCKANGVLADQPYVDDLYVIPVSSDSGTALGAALWIGRDDLDINGKTSTVYWGPGYDNDEIEYSLRKNNLTFEKTDDISGVGADLIAKDKIVGWYQGKLEAGPRALGNRSILGNPASPNIKDLVNQKVKYRETWRPFAPSVLKNRSKDYFEHKVDSPFMIIACQTRDEYKRQLPSVVHIDGTVRIQEVDEGNAKFAHLIEGFERRTGHPVVLNTSFNVKDEPIVCNPDDAIRCYLKSGMDSLCIGDYLVNK